ncbi:hypothetical protein G6F65_012764 [Rhizopus arrhizus]|nr:hypothetical protein G6F65_012764 [Rhizopus arrhizus]
MMSDPGSDFRLYHSNSLDVLAALLARNVRAPVAGQPLLAPEVVLIPQVAMRRWLQATLAAEFGVAANLEFLTPGEFVARALKANVSGEQDDLDAAGLHWKLYQALRDPALLAQPPMRALQSYLAGGDALKPWALAGELASVFEKYQAWRRDWLLRWAAGADPADPQAILWRTITHGHDYRARRIQEYLDRFEGAGQPLPKGLPLRMSAFATLNISPDVLRVLATQARVGELHFYMPTPVQSYWGDLQTLAERLRSGAPDPFGEAAGENRLLEAWGAAGRDFMAVLGSYEVVHPAGEIAAYSDPEEDTRPALDEGGLSDSLLHRLQRDLFHRRALPSGELRDGLRSDDPSLQVHACHTRLRELQVLHDQLRSLLQDARFDPPLQAREIAVLAPDIDPYVPYLEAVFGGRGGEEEHIPYALADSSPLAGEPLADVFVHLLGLPVSRFGLNEVLDLLASAPLAEAAGLEAVDFDRLHGWLQQAGARWGLDAKHRDQHQAPADDAYTWQFALDRLVLGHATGSEADLAGVGVAPWIELEGGALEALDRLLRLLRVLAVYQRRLGELLTPARQAEYGAMMLRELRNYGYLLDDPLVNDWLQTMGTRLGSNSDQPRQPYTFFVMKDRQINAFATLGGYIGVNAGLVLTAEREDEVAAVLSHEIAHVTQQHVLRGVERAQRDQIPILLGMLAAVVAAQASNSTSSGNATMAAISSGMGLMQQRQINYTRATESEADRLGSRTLARSGYDVDAMAGFFERMAAAMRGNEGGYSVPEFLRTHPGNITRISEAKARAEQMKKDTVLLTTSTPSGERRERVDPADPSLAEPLLRGNNPLLPSSVLRIPIGQLSRAPPPPPNWSANTPTWPSARRMA